MEENQPPGEFIPLKKKPKDRKRKRWIILGQIGAIVLLCSLCYGGFRYFLDGPHYISPPDFEFDDVIEESSAKYRSEGSPTFYIKEVRYILPETSFENEAALNEYLDSRIVQDGWIDNDNLSWKIVPYCERTISSYDYLWKVYADAEFAGSSANNRGAAPHMCVFTNHSVEDHTYEIIVATLCPSLISALADG
ncbi:MAG: hypothetical protein JXJ17_14440 [Anaerolineae bacterium]|nr:hypothetical protein [Anaerolineae bacterium]